MLTDEDSIKLAEIEFLSGNGIDIVARCHAR